MCGRFLLVLAVAGARTAAAEEADMAYLPPDFAKLYLESPLLAGMEEIQIVAKDWQAELPTDAATKKIYCEKISFSLTKAADAPHDIFNGLRLFATTMRKAADSADVAKMDKALSMRGKFSKALERITDQVRSQIIQQKVIEEQRRQAAEAAAADDTTDDDVDFDSDDDLGDDHDEF